MDNYRFWVLVERGSYVATLFIGLVEMSDLLVSHLF